MEMKIGFSTAILWDYENLDIQNAILRGSDLGFEAVEIHCEDPFFKGWGTGEADSTVEKIEESLASTNMEIALHAPYHDSNIASLNKGINGEVLRQLEQCVETARYLGSEIIVVHPGFVSSRKFKRDKSFRMMVSNLKKIAELVRDEDIKICVENLAAKKKAIGIEISELKKILEQVDEENLKITLDLAHANTTGDGPVKFVQELEGEIAHVHVSDNTGEDNHLSIGQGDIDFEGVFKELMPFDGIAMLEGWIPRNEEPFLIYNREELEKIRNKLTR